LHFQLIFNHRILNRVFGYIGTTEQTLEVYFEMESIGNQNKVFATLVCPIG